MVRALAVDEALQRAEAGPASAIRENADTMRGMMKQRERERQEAERRLTKYMAYEDASFFRLQRIQ